MTADKLALAQSQQIAGSIGFLHANFGIQLTWSQGGLVQQIPMPVTPGFVQRTLIAQGGLNPLHIQTSLLEIQRKAALGLDGIRQGSVLDITADFPHLRPGGFIISVGAQGGDEGKGKIADYLCQQSDIVVRSCGGNNARYTFGFEGREYQLRHIPLGIVDPSKTCVIGPGMYVDPGELIGEMWGLREGGITVSPQNFMISSQARAVLPIFRLMSRVEDAAKLKMGTKISTTSKGTGPAAAADAAKRGLPLWDFMGTDTESPSRRMRMLFDSTRASFNGIRLDETLMIGLATRTYAEELIKLLTVFYAMPDFGITGYNTIPHEGFIPLIDQSITPDALRGDEETWDELMSVAETMAKSFLPPTISGHMNRDNIFYSPALNLNLFSLYTSVLSSYMHPNSDNDFTIPQFIDSALFSGKIVYLQGVQGTLISRTQGVYPYTAGPNSVAPNLLEGLCLGTQNVLSVVGVIKAYQTLSGGGQMPFPTEIHADQGEISAEDMHHIREIGGEFGVTIGGRRLGWIDIPVLKYTARTNGLTSWGMTHLDGLTGLKSIKICVGYRLEDGSMMDPDGYSPNPDFLRNVTPVYISLPGWNEDITGARKIEDLPVNAQNYLKKVAELSGTPITVIGVGPSREETIQQRVSPNGQIGPAGE